jgi:hypothetical protein
MLSPVPRLTGRVPRLGPQARLLVSRPLSFLHPLATVRGVQGRHHYMLLWKLPLSPFILLPDVVAVFLSAAGHPATAGCRSIALASNLLTRATYPQLPPAVTALGMAAVPFKPFLVSSLNSVVRPTSACMLCSMMHLASLSPAQGYVPAGTLVAPGPCRSNHCFGKDQVPERYLRCIDDCRHASHAACHSLQVP